VFTQFKMIQLLYELSNFPLFLFSFFTSPFFLKASKINSETVSMNDKQVLIELIITYLRDSSNLNETTSQFVKRVRDQFVKYLLMSNTIPEPVFRDVLTDLEEEIVDIYRKKTYGYQSLKEFRISRILKN
jgi:hypothetical protein